MKSYRYSEARGNFATVLDEAERTGLWKFAAGTEPVFRILPLRKSKSSPLDVKGVKLKSVGCRSGCNCFREGRERG